MPELADRINEEHRQVVATVNKGIKHALEAGRLLIEAKAQCPHGTWGNWLDDHFDGSNRSARVYIQVARKWPEIESKMADSANLGIDGSVKLLAGGDPRPARQPRAGEYVLPFGLTWSLESDHIAVTMPSGRVAKLRKMGLEAPDEMTFEEWKQMLYMLCRYGEGLYTQLATRIGEAA